MKLRLLRSGGTLKLRQALAEVDLTLPSPPEAGWRVAGRERRSCGSGLSIPFKQRGGFTKHASDVSAHDLRNDPPREPAGDEARGGDSHGLRTTLPSLVAWRQRPSPTPLVNSRGRRQGSDCLGRGLGLGNRLVYDFRSHDCYLEILRQNAPEAAATSSGKRVRKAL